MLHNEASLEAGLATSHPKDDVESNSSDEIALQPLHTRSDEEDDSLDPDSDLEKPTDRAPRAKKPPLWIAIPLSLLSLFFLAAILYTIWMHGATVSKPPHPAPTPTNQTNRLVPTQPYLLTTRLQILLYALNAAVFCLYIYFWLITYPLRLLVWLIAKILGTTGALGFGLGWDWCGGHPEYWFQCIGGFDHGVAAVAANEALAAAAVNASIAGAGG